MSNSNRAHIDAMLDAWVNAIDLTDPTSQCGKQMADAVLDVMADGIHRRSIDQQADPTGMPWADNAKSYRKKKEKGDKPVGVLTGQMLGDFNAFMGTRSYEPKRVEMRYGQDDYAYRKAQWFTRGSETNEPQDIEYSGANGYQPPRPFYELDDAIRQQAMEKVDEHFAAHVASFGNGGGGIL